MRLKRYIIWQVSASYRHGCFLPTISFFMLVFTLSSNSYQHSCVLLTTFLFLLFFLHLITHRYISHWLIIENYFMSKIGNKDIGSIYVSHVCTSHKICIDRFMIYVYKIDYMNIDTYMHKMGNTNIFTCDIRFS